MAGEIFLFRVKKKPIQTQMLLLRSAPLYVHHKIHTAAAEEAAPPAAALAAALPADPYLFLLDFSI